MKFIITAHPKKKVALKIKKEIKVWIQKKKHQVVKQNQKADIVIALGGDGFLIHTVGKYSPKKIPCVGINAENVGFLTSGDNNNWKKILIEIINKNYKIEKRIGLELQIKKKKYGPFVNDVYLKNLVSMSFFDVKIDSEYIYKNLSSDGIIVSTPTGSTGYNTSAGGPIIQPGVFSLLLTPICPFHLNTRSLVINPDSKIEIKIKDTQKKQNINLIADGKNISNLIKKENSLIVKKHSKKLLFIILNKHNFYKALQEKKGLMNTN